MGAALRLAAALILSGLAVGCATVRAPEPPPATSGDRDRPPPAPVQPPAASPGSFTQTGYASWYGKAHQGRKTSSGEPYDMNQLTAAHPTLPMGTRLLVTNLKNGRSVSVRVNDRGPSIDGRVIDLSYAAAREIDAVGDGVVRVRISVINATSR